MKKSTLKILIIAAALLLGIVLAVLSIRTAKTLSTRAATDVAPASARATDLTPNSAKIVWTSQKESQGVVLYGTSPSDLTQVAFETTPSTSHSVTLSLLNENVTYYFKIKVSDTTYDSSGQPWSFKTIAQLTPTPTPFPCDLSQFKQRFGTADPIYDFDKNGLVNTRDYLECLGQ